MTDGWQAMGEEKGKGEKIGRAEGRESEVRKTDEGGRGTDGILGLEYMGGRFRWIELE